ncbi:hypothetical protein PR003_g25843 [Phytophthora rubi]|uniref:Uncharacterized protein n=1 Tax=Phytophthora rubi TaxID=129364 RepID=A0A6A3ICI6_9STRA|nr:hypothetical protein PR002_g24988 [Phytophthora rubi]KAE8979162.1 hypothetical protein PR001_g24634 [Phytophthora rubi]KAE9288271.1 hypothetical protein PR003_g25843 [Phytophthora rubi]
MEKTPPLDDRKQYVCPMAGWEKDLLSNLMARFSAVHDEIKTMRFASNLR